VVDRGEVLGANLFELSGFQRLFLRMRAKLVKDGHLLDQVFRVPWLKGLIRHGYVIVAVERRGTGASFGTVHPSFEVSAREADEILSWIAEQPWSDGSVGMFGDSYEAMTQYAAASSGNRHLKAIFPCSSSFDFYDAILYPGGIYNRGFASVLARAMPVLETMVEPVDGDREGALLSEVLEHRKKRTLGRASGEAFQSAPFRDSTRAGGPRLWDEMSLYTLLDRIQRSGVPVYNSNGWNDIFTRDMFLWHANLETPQRLHVRPAHHRDMGKSGRDLDVGAEAHRWFDYWLKGIDNGIMDEAPIHYYVMGAPERDAWRTSGVWPLADQHPTRFYLAEGKTGSVDSTNDGFLRTQPPQAPHASDAYTVDYTTTSGVNSRWNILGSGRYGDLGPNDEKALTYTTPPLDSDVEITGHPVVHLWLSSEAPDVDLFVYLEEVDRAGRSTYVTEGNLRASHRALAEPPYRNLGLPYHRSHRSDVTPLPQGKAIELVLDLQPVSRLFHRGNRIRLSIAAADRDNFDTPIRDPAPRVHLLRSAAHTSFVLLPVIPPASPLG
jgi:putative CocE/NonD family hydrolase